MISRNNIVKVWKLFLNTMQKICLKISFHYPQIVK